MSSSFSSHKSHFLFTLLGLLALAALALLIHGYHFGIEDQAIYLPAIKRILDPALYPHDSGLFMAQAGEMFFPQMVAATTRLSHLPPAWVILIWQQVSIFALLAGGLRLARLWFRSARAQWCAVTMLAAVLTLPVAATALYISDPYLHPRTPATALLLFMLAEVMERRFVRAIILLATAALLHIQMAFYGALLALSLLLPEGWMPHLGPPKRGTQTAVAVFIPFGALFERATPAWREATRTRWQHYLLRWPWYAWVGIFAPLLLIAWFGRVAARATPAGTEDAGGVTGMTKIARLAPRLVSFGIFVFVVSAIITMLPALERLTPYQPMRGFHLIYIFLFLLGGGLLGEFVLRARAWRWTVLFLPLALVMFYVQRQTLPASPHIEWPGARPSDPWLEAFDWARQNTPKDAYFALDPMYAERPQEDFHGFRGFAERSMMADYVKDSGVALLFPAVATRWQREVQARKGWQKFTPADFKRLHRDFGVNWFVIERGHPAFSNLECPYANELVAVCRLP